MTEMDLKKKYLKQANHLIRRDDRTIKRKLQASVEPVRAKHSTEKWRSVGEQNDSCSDSEYSLSRRNSSSQLAQFDTLPSPPLELRPLLPSNSVRPSPTAQHKIHRTPLVSLSVASPGHSHRLSVSDPHQNATVDVSELEIQLRMLTDINRELKRLLVASVGSDLELRLQQMVQEKAELSQDLNLSLQEAMNHHEELDQVSIECDIWRSKFIASRFMIDELASWKAELSLQLRESRKALQHMMVERGEICRELQECNAHLHKTLSELETRTHSLNSHHMMITNSANVAAVSPVQYSTAAGTKVGEKATVLDLAHGNTVAARKLTPQLCRFTVGNDRSVPMGIIPPCVVEPTTGERLAQRVMESRGDFERTRDASPPLPKLLLTDEDLLHHRPSAASVGSSLPPLSRRLFHFGAKALEDPFRVPFHCSKCRGKIIIL